MTDSINNLKSFSHVKRLPREAASCVILRRKGYSINTLSHLLGRSTSFIHRILKVNNLTGYSFFGAGFTVSKSWHRLDKRKSTGRMRDCTIPWAHLTREMWQKWEAFILGETDKPP